MKNMKTHLNGFTLIELITALMVATIILTAAVTLAYAISSAYDSTVEMNEKQARIRYTDLRITNLILPMTLPSLLLKMPAAPGTAIFIPAGVSHKLICSGDVPIRYIVVYAPPGPEQKLKQEGKDSFRREQ